SAGRDGIAVPPSSAAGNRTPFRPSGLSGGWGHGVGNELRSSTVRLLRGRLIQERSPDQPPESVLGRCLGSTTTPCHLRPRPAGFRFSDLLCRHPFGPGGYSPHRPPQVQENRSLLAGLRKPGGPRAVCTRAAAAARPEGQGRALAVCARVVSV